MLIVRRIVGESMLPGLRPGQIIIARCLFRRVRQGEVVIIRHGGMEKVKRVQKYKNGRVFVLGDNPAASTDSRSFGWLPKSAVRAKLAWPIRPRRSASAREPVLGAQSRR